MTDEPIRDQSRRDLLKTLAAGALYAAPVIVSMAAPSRLGAQGPSAPMMMTLCDFFPILCMWLGGAPAPATPGAPGAMAPGTAPNRVRGPWDAPPPGSPPPRP